MQERQEMWVQSLDPGDSLEEEMSPHSSILTQKISQSEEPGRLLFMGLSGECVISSVLSHHSKNLKWQTSVTARLQLTFKQQTSISAQFYLASKGKYILKAGRQANTKEETIRGVQFWLLFSYIFPPPPEPALCKLGQPGGLFVSPEILTPVL